jgi:hypothetical protein
MDQIIIALINNMPAILTAIGLVVTAAASCIAAWHGIQARAELAENTTETIKGKNAAIAAEKVGQENKESIKAAVAPAPTGPATVNVENLNVEVQSAEPAPQQPSTLEDPKK